MPPMLPTTPLPLNVVTSNVMYMYSCSQCEFKTHIESLFKQHVDSVHLGIPNVPNNLVLGQTVQQQTAVQAAGQTSTATASIVSAVASPSPASPVSVAVTSPLPQGNSVTLPLQSGLISVTQATPQTLVMSSGGQLLATGGHLGSATIVNPQGQTTAVMSGGDKLHKCPKCNLLLPSKNQLTLHKRKVHGKVAMAAATGGALTQSPGPVTYAVVSSPGPATAVQHSSASVVASLVSQVSQQPVSILAQAAAAAQAAAVASAGGGAGTTTGTPGIHTSTNITGKKTYSCSACGYSTTRRDGLSQHYDSVHLKIKNHQCELCPYAASQKGTLNRHVKLRHKKKVEVLS